MERTFMETLMAGGPDGQTRVGRGGKLRSETVTVRLDPKLRYLAELAARKQRRTLSSFIEWAIEHALLFVPVAEGPNWSTNIGEIDEKLWDVEDADRFAKLALQYPDLLTHHEQIVWKLIRENGFLWKGRYQGEWTWIVREESLLFDRLRENWATFNEVARGDAPKSKLPTWVKVAPKPPPPQEPDECDNGPDDDDF
jgi:hypothetical protein